MPPKGSPNKRKRTVQPAYKPKSAGKQRPASGSAGKSTPSRAKPAPRKGPPSMRSAKASNVQDPAAKRIGALEAKLRQNLRASAPNGGDFFCS